MDFQFWVSLIKARPNNNFIKNNCTHIKNRYHFYEGCTDLLKEEVPDAEILAEGVVGCLGGLGKEKLSKIARDNLGIDLTQKTLCKNGEHDWSSGPWIEQGNGGTASCVCGETAINESLRCDF